MTSAFIKLPIVLALVLAACAMNRDLSPTIQIIDEAGKNIHILNLGSKSIVIRYGYRDGFGTTQMFHVRYRDGSKTIIHPNVFDDEGWWTPHYLWQDNRPAPLRLLRIPAHGYVELKRDFDSLSLGITVLRAFAGPCELQLRLFAYADSRRKRVIQALSGWQPAPCPPYHARTR